MARVHWPAVALLSLLAAGLLLLRDQPLAPVFLFLPLLIWPWAGR